MKINYMIHIYCIYRLNFNPQRYDTKEEMLYRLFSGVVDVVVLILYIGVLILIQNKPYRGNELVVHEFMG